MAKKQISRTGYEKLQKQYEELISVKRAEVAQKLKEARSFGDLSENSEYDEAKNEQAMLEAKIARIEYDLENCDIVDDDMISTQEVGMGSVVDLKDELGRVKRYQIVSTNEIDIAAGKISDESPLGSQAMRKKTGDEFSVVTPNGEKKYTIMNISK
ncbi:MAG: transcription elongation factor GreA [Oscillospiraceae bacterium]|jgi:transcription elongation factor GreA|nr:transcription elongation factor GreA [Oscillospiraceae bacterium]